MRDGDDGRLSAEGDFMLIWGVAAGLLTGLYAIDGTVPTVLLLGGIATVASLAAVAADLTRPDFRPSTGLHAIIALASAAAAVVAYVYGRALITASGLAVVAVANAGRVYEVGHRDTDSLLDPLEEDEGSDDATESEERSSRSE